MADLKFPLFLDMTGRPAAVFGGGSIALRRVRTLLAFGAEVTVTAPEILPALLALEGVHFRQRPYAPGDIGDAFLVLAATDNPELNHAITMEAISLGRFANNASNQLDNNFFFPAVAMTEEISVGICGTGRDHSGVAKTAARIRTLLEEGGSV